MALGLAPTGSSRISPKCFSTNSLRVLFNSLERLTVSRALSGSEAAVNTASAAAGWSILPAALILAAPPTKQFLCHFLGFGSRLGVFRFCLVSELLLHFDGDGVCTTLRFSIRKLMSAARPDSSLIAN